MGGGKREGERRNIDQLLPVGTLTGDQTHNLGVRDDASTNWPTRPGPFTFLKNNLINLSDFSRTQALGGQELYLIFLITVAPEPGAES